MRDWILVICFLFAIPVAASNKDNETRLGEAEKLVLENPQKAFSIAQKVYADPDVSHAEKIQSLFIMTNTSNLMQKPLTVIQYGNEVLKIADNRDDLATKIKILGILGNTYQFLKLNEKARYYLDQAELLLASPKLRDSMDLVRGNTFYLKAMNYFYSLDSDIAISYFNKAIDQYGRSKNPLSEINIKLAYLNKAFCLINQNKTQEARENLKFAAVTPNETSKPYPLQFTQLQDAFIELGNARILAAEDHHAESNLVLLRLLEQRKNAQAREDIENDSYQLLAENFLQLGDIAKHDYYESLFSKQSAKSNRESAKLVSQLIAQNSKNYNAEKKSINLNYLLLIIVLGVTMAVILSVILLKTINVYKKQRDLKKKIFSNL